MLGFLFGSACVVGLVKTLRGGCGGYGSWRSAGCGPGARWGHQGGWGHHGRHHGGHGRWGGGGYGGRWMLRGLFERLETTPGQEKVILQAVEDIQGAFAKRRGEWDKARENIAQALRNESFDHDPMKQMFSRQDTEFEDLRKTLLVSLEKVHEALTPSQRQHLADLIQNGFGDGRHGGWHHRRWGGGGHGWEGAQSL